MKCIKIAILLFVGALTLTGCGNKKQIQEYNDKLTSINKILVKGQFDLAEKQLNEISTEVTKSKIEDKGIEDKIKNVKTNINKEKEKASNLKEIEHIKNLISSEKLKEAEEKIKFLDNKNISNNEIKEMINQCKNMENDKRQELKNKQEKIEKERKKQEELKNKLSIEEAKQLIIKKTKEQPFSAYEVNEEGNLEFAEEITNSPSDKEKIVGLIGKFYKFTGCKENLYHFKTTTFEYCVALKSKQVYCFDIGGSNGKSFFNFKGNSEICSWNYFNPSKAHAGEDGGWWYYYTKNGQDLEHKRLTYKEW